jgi:hypothetical protein
MQNQSKHWLKRIFIGFKKGYQTPTLPDHILKITNYPIIRILRFLGGLSFLLILSKNYLNYPIIVLYLAMFIATIYTIYHFIISYFKIKHIIKILRSDELDIRNSPLDRLATLGARALLCFKGACDTTAQPVGLTLGLMLGADEIFKAGDIEPVFAPLLSGILKTVLPDSVTKSSMKLINENISNITNNNIEMLNNDSLLEKFQSLNLKGDLSKDEFLEMRKLLIENQDQLKKENTVFKSKILELLDKKNK